MRRRLTTLQQDAGRPVGRAVRALALGLVGLSALALLPWRLATLGRPAAAPAPQDDPLPLYELTDLGTLGGRYSDALAINDAGDVVGAANVYPQGGMGHAFLSRGGGRMDDLAAGSIYRHSTAHDVNEAGKVAASAYRSSYRKTAQFAFVWDGSQRVYLGTLPGFAFARAVGINDRDQVVGNALTGRTDGSGAVESRAFLWQERRMRELGTLGGSHSHATAINDAGLVVGKADLPAPEDGEKPATHAFLYDDGSMRDLGALPGGRNSVALSVNGRGAVVGYSEAGDAAGGPRAFVWEDGAMRDLGTPEGFRAAAALGINDAGVAVGQAVPGDRTEPRAVVWLPGDDERRRALDLNGRLTANPDRWVLETARAVNARGQIVGRGQVGGQRRAFLLTPVPPTKKA